MNKPNISVVIPAYNEEKNIKKTLDETSKFLEKEFPNYEIIVVNDGSTDLTRNIIEDYPNKKVILINNDKNRGKGYSVKQGVLKAKGKKIIFMDADLAYPPSNIKTLVDANKSAKVSIGSRSVPGAIVEVRPPLHRRIMAKVFLKLCALLMGLNYADTQCGIKCFDREVAKKIFQKQRIFGWGFDVELLFLAKKYNYKIAQVPIHLRKEHSFQTSKLNPIKDPIKMFFDLLRIKLFDLLGKY
ncbi:glycosyltransferase family 2 protein [Candidatus Woesearchaeota archaeon]|nr:glycosyltransferase family 2 protein [Candidatus Woesearchaeota archaeon]